MYVEGPDELVGRSVELLPGDYALYIGQTALAFSNDEEPDLLICLYFEPLETPLEESAILVQDDNLAPVYPLLEEAEIMQV